MSRNTMKANDTDNYEGRQHELAASVLKQAEQDLRRFHGAAGADLAFFTPGVKPMLHRLDSSEDYSRTKGGSVKTQLGPSETAFIGGQDSFYVAAIGEDRWSYTQRHRGPKGFLRVLDARILGFASLAGSRRYISPGNAILFLIDYALPARLKIWADAEVSEDPAIIEKLAKSRGHAPVTHLAFLFHVRAFGWNSENTPCSAPYAKCAAPNLCEQAKPIRFNEDDALNRSRDFQPNERTSIISFLAAQNHATRNGRSLRNRQRSQASIKTNQPI